MINIIKEKIKSYYSQCGYNDYIDFSKELIIFYYVIADNDFIEIRSDINKYKVTTYYNDTKINEITFLDIKSYYFYFIKNINEKYFIKNIIFRLVLIIRIKKVSLFLTYFFIKLLD